MNKLVLFAVVFSLLLVFDTDAWWGRRRRRRRRWYKIYRRVRKIIPIGDFPVEDGKQDNIDFETGEAVMVVRVIQ